MSQRPRGFIANYRPRTNAGLLDQVQLILDEYREQLPLTCRQIFYRLVGRYAYEKNELAYKRLCELLNKARRGGLIPFDHIRDDGNSVNSPPLWLSGEQWIEAVRHNVARPISNVGAIINTFARLFDNATCNALAHDK